VYLRAEAFVFESFAALLLATGAAHAAGPTQAELSNAASESANLLRQVSTLDSR
jgi:hypothetical protein